MLTDTDTRSVYDRCMRRGGVCCFPHGGWCRASKEVASYRIVCTCSMGPIIVHTAYGVYCTVHSTSYTTRAIGTRANIQAPSRRREPRALPEPYGFTRMYGRTRNPTVGIPTQVVRFEPSPMRCPCHHTAIRHHHQRSGRQATLILYEL